MRTESHNPASPGKCNSSKTLLIFHVLPVLIRFPPPSPFPSGGGFVPGCLCANNSALSQLTWTWSAEGFGAGKTHCPRALDGAGIPILYPLPQNHLPKCTNIEKKEGKNPMVLSLPARLIPNLEAGILLLLSLCGPFSYHDFQAGQRRGAT